MRINSIQDREIPSIDGGQAKAGLDHRFSLNLDRIVQMAFPPINTP